MANSNLKTEDSVSNLVKPTLYSIYDKDITTSSTDYSALRYIPNVNEPILRKEKKLHQQIIIIIYAIIVLFLSLIHISEPTRH